MPTIEKFAKTVINQHDLNYGNSRNDWKNPENAQNNTPDIYAVGRYSKEKSKYKKPHVLYAYDFEVGEDLPQGAYIKSVKFSVRMAHKGNLDVKAPVGLYNHWQEGVKTIDSTEKTGWYNGAYRYAPSKKIGYSFEWVDYTISQKNLAKYKEFNKTLRNQGFGLQLRFRDAKTTGDVYISRIKIIVEYEMPSRYFEFQTISRDVDNPTEIPIKEQVCFKLVTGNSSRASENNRTYIVDLPIGMEIQHIDLGGICDYTLDGNVITWTVNGEGNQSVIWLFAQYPMQVD